MRHTMNDKGYKYNAWGTGGLAGFEGQRMKRGYKKWVKRTLNKSARRYLKKELLNETLIIQEA